MPIQNSKTEAAAAAPKAGEIPESQLRKRTTVAVLARNEEDTIGDVIRAVIPYAGETLLIDGNSTDRTREIAESLGAVVHLDSGRGKGDGIRKAIEVAGGDVVVFMDADGSHDAADIPRLAAPILAGQADLVVGSRWLGGSDELAGDLRKFIRSTGSQIIALTINYRWNVRLTDIMNGFRAMSVQAARALDLEEPGFTIEEEMIMKSLQKGFRLAEVSAHEYKRQGGQPSFRVYKVWYKFVWTVLKNLVRKRID